MVKKIHKSAGKAAAAASSLLDSQLAQNIKDSAHQIWLAGLGAFAKAQGEGTKVFDTLIKEGVSLHRKTQAAAEERVADMAGKVTAMAGGVGSKANAQWDKLESIFEERTARAMNKLGVPTAKDVAALTERVDALAAAVARLGQPAGSGRPGKAPAAKAGGKASPRAARAAAGSKAAPAKPAPAKPSPARPAARKRAAKAGGAGSSE